jgi:hypothetical protein
MHCVEANYLWYPLISLWNDQELMKPEVVPWKDDYPPWQPWKSEIMRIPTATFLCETYETLFPAIWLVNSFQRKHFI